MGNETKHLNQDRDGLTAKEQEGKRNVRVQASAAE